MPTESDRDFVKIAIQKGYLSAEQAKEILVLLGQSERNRARLSVDRLMVMEEILKQEQVAEIQKAQHRKIVFCVCGQKTNIFQFQPGSQVKCKSCGRIIEIYLEGDDGN